MVPAQRSPELLRAAVEVLDEHRRVLHGRRACVATTEGPRCGRGRGVNPVMPCEGWRVRVLAPGCTAVCPVPHPAAVTAGLGVMALTGCFTPPTTIPHTPISRIAFGSPSSGLRSSTVKSASFPVRMLPMRSSTPSVYAASIVTILSACIGVMRSAGPSTLPLKRPMRFTAIHMLSRGIGGETGVSVCMAVTTPAPTSVPSRDESSARSVPR
ncbi:MAG: hypothetical protein RLZ94_2704 [Actinomycetota bacterium]